MQAHSKHARANTPMFTTPSSAVRAALASRALARPRTGHISRGQSTAADLVVAAIALGIAADIAGTFIKQMSKKNEVVEPVVVDDSDDEKQYRNYNIKRELLYGETIDASKDAIDID